MVVKTHKRSMRSKRNSSSKKSKMFKGKKTMKNGKIMRGGVNPKKWLMGVLGRKPKLTPVSSVENYLYENNSGFPKSANRSTNRSTNSSVVNNSRHLSSEPPSSTSSTRTLSLKSEEEQELLQQYEELEAKLNDPETILTEIQEKELNTKMIKIEEQILELSKKRELDDAQRNRNNNAIAAAQAQAKGKKLSKKQIAAAIAAARKQYINSMKIRNQRTLY